MNEQEQAHEILRDKVPTLIGLGEYDEAMDLLVTVDQLDGLRAKETTNLRHVIAALRAEEEPSPGISSLTSESRPDRSGTSAPETESSLQSPAQDVESPSDKDPLQKPASSTADLTDGSTQETGSSQSLQSDSSEESAAATQATPDQETEEVVQEDGQPVTDELPKSKSGRKRVGPG